MTKPIPLPEESKYIDTSKWQDSSDPIERMAYWINWLSPHNLRKSKSALQEMLSQAQQEAVERERERIKNYIELKKKYWSNDGLERSDLWFSRLAGYEDVLEALKGQE